MDIKEELIRHAAAIERLVDDPDVQLTFERLNAYYFEHWTTAEKPDDRDVIWAEMRALGRLRQAFRDAVATGQAEAHSLAQKANPTRRD